MEMTDPGYAAGIFGLDVSYRAPEVTCSPTPIDHRDSA